jgi:hypothetical protein
MYIVKYQNLLRVRKRERDVERVRARGRENMRCRSCDKYLFT